MTLLDDTEARKNTVRRVVSETLDGLAGSIEEEVWDALGETAQSAEMWQSIRDALDELAPQLENRSLGILAVHLAEQMKARQS